MNEYMGITGEKSFTFLRQPVPLTHSFLLIAL